MKTGQHTGGSIMELHAEEWKERRREDKKEAQNERCDVSC